MTIKRKWKVNVPILGLEFDRSRILRKGHTEKVVVNGLYGDGRDRADTRYRLRVLSDDKISMEELEKRTRKIVGSQDFVHFFNGEVSNFEDLPDAPYIKTYEQDEINTRLLHHGYDDKLYTLNRGPLVGITRSVGGKKIEIEWEPTLPSQARK
ncbi:MAG: hypothetical protein ACD_50C00235G0011 [uncultured bacterium]|nr:MAG: hypothetical protein ACD_50C00235G0011 [uncultured bacterium]OGH14522.1 MAG: hypothetical protein A2687_05685 [Candidatus Levybacteria bacterium RIFCSPHIGHO2_01_FULL_38_26]